MQDKELIQCRCESSRFNSLRQNLIIYLIQKCSPVWLALWDRERCTIIMRRCVHTLHVFHPGCATCNWRGMMVIVFNIEKCNMKPQIFFERILYSHGA